MGRRANSRLVSALTMAAVLAVSMVPAAQATPSTAGDAQLVAVEGNTLAHTIRYANGNWQRFGHLDAAPVGEPTSVIIKGEEHLFFHTSTTLRHYIRHVDGTWDLAGSVPTVTANELDTMAAAGLNGRIALIRKHGDGALLSIQQGDGTWSTWESVPLGLQPVWSESLTADGGTLRVAGVTADGKNLAMVSRSPEGVWSSPTYRTLGVLGNSLIITAAGIAQIGTDLHVMVSYSFNGTRLWHLILHADGTWSDIGEVESNDAAGPIPNLMDFAVAAAPGGSLQVAVATTSGLFHTVRHADGTWQRFGDVAGAAGPVNTTRITLSADNG